MGRLGAVTLVPAALLVLVARVVVVGLVRKPPQVMTTPVSRQPLLGPQGPTRTQAGAIVQRPVETRLTRIRPGRAVGRLAPQKAVAAVTVAGAGAVPVPVALPRQVLTVAA